MIKITHFLTGLAALLVLSGCSAPTVPVTPTPVKAQPTSNSVTVLPTQQDPIPNPTAPVDRAIIPALTGDWQVSLQKTGGIMGMSRKVIISSNRKISLLELRTQKSAQLDLSEVEEKGLASLVAQSRYKPPASASGCADCFIFTLDISSSSGSFSAELDQLELVDSGLLPLVQFLSRYLDTHTP